MRREKIIKRKSVLVRYEGVKKLISRNNPRAIIRVKNNAVINSAYILSSEILLWQ